MVWVRSKKKYMRTGTAAASHRTSGAGKLESPAEKPLEPRVPVWLIVGPALFLAGIAAGAVFSGNAPREAVSHLDFLFQTDFRLRLEDPFFSGFVSSLASSFLLAAVCFLCGLSIWGTFLLPLVPVARGVGVGLVAGYLYTAYGLQGGAFYWLLFLPGTLIGSVGIFLAVQESWRFSKRLSIGGSVKAKIGPYAFRFGLFLVPCLMGALLEWGTSAIFSSLFSF